MDVLDFAEAQGQRNAAFSLETLEFMSKRAHALLTLLLGGAGATGAYALGQYGKPGAAPTVVALGVVAVWWFALAAWVLIRAVRTQEVRAPSCAGYVLLEHSRALDDFIRQEKAEGGAPSDCLTLLREGELKTLQETADGYRQASQRVAHALDWACLGAVMTPFWAGLSVLLARFLS